MEDIFIHNLVESPPRKRLLAVTNPNKTFVTVSPESTYTNPSLSDCHGCGVRVNCTNPRDRLQPLDSMWRIVLLCKKCTKRVNSSELCPYCFCSVVNELDCFKCSECNHSIHKECVKRCGSGLGLSVSVCVDCWIPDAFVNSVRVRKRNVRKRNHECCEQADTDSDTLFEVRVSVGEFNERNSVGGFNECNSAGGFNERNSVDKEVERKVAAAAEATENALRKAVAAKNAVELAKGVLSVVAGSKDGYDVELAVLLRRAINSSPRLSRYVCLGSSFRRDGAATACYSRRRAGKNSTLDGRLICYSRRHGKGCFGNSVSLNAPLMCYSRRLSRSNTGLLGRECECFICKTSEKTDEHVSMKACNYGSNSDKISRNNGQENDVGKIAMKPRRSLLKYYRIGKGTTRPLFFVKESDGPHINSASLRTEGMTGTRNFGNGYECHNICEKFDDNANRFLLKYRRKIKI